MKSISALLLITLPAFGQVKVTVQNDNGTGATRYPKVNACNQTQALRMVEGWRFRTKDFPGYTTWMAGLTKQGAGPVEYTQSIPESEVVMASGQCRAAPTDYTGTWADGQDGTLLDPQALVKTGSCHAEYPSTEASARTCLEVYSIRGQPEYYGNGLCELGRQAKGGFVLTTIGNTQFRAAIPKNAVTVSGTQMKWDPRVMGPQYMMALAAVQEIFHADMRVMAAVAGKETGFGWVKEGEEGRGSISENGGYTDNAGTVSPWQLEEATFARLVQTYPAFFPQYGPCLSRHSDLSRAVPACNTSYLALAGDYLRVPGTIRMSINSAHIINAMVSSALSFYWFFDALVQSTDLPVPQALDFAKDKRVVLAAMLAGYNLGARAGFETAFADPVVLTDPNASSRFPAGNNNYRVDIFNMMDALDSATLRAPYCFGSLPVYDTAISLTEIRRFFFGDTAKSNSSVYYHGGLLLHFSLDAKQRQDLWSEVQCTFDKLKGMAPITGGKDFISFRYDWLTVLRTAKSWLKAPREAAPEIDFRATVTRNSRNPKTSSGRTIDKTYPRLTLVPAPALAESTWIRIPVKAEDENPGVRLSYSLDTAWLHWRAADTVADPDVFKVSCLDPLFPAAGKTGRLWARATDACGNATVQEFEFSVPQGYTCGDPVSIAKAPSLRRGKPRLQLARERGALRVRARLPDASGSAEMDGRILP